MCLFVAALAMFPRGSRVGGRVPIEVVVLGAAFLERSVGFYLPAPDPFGPFTGPFLLLGAALLIFIVRFRVFVPPPIRRRAA